MDRAIDAFNSGRDGTVGVQALLLSLHFDGASIVRAQPLEPIAHLLEVLDHDDVALGRVTPTHAVILDPLDRIVALGVLDGFRVRRSPRGDALEGTFTVPGTGGQTRDGVDFFLRLQDHEQVFVLPFIVRMN